jgi:hypothetical protein
MHCGWSGQVLEPGFFRGKIEDSINLSTSDKSHSARERQCLFSLRPAYHRAKKLRALNPNHPCKGSYNLLIAGGQIVTNVQRILSGRERRASQVRSTKDIRILLCSHESQGLRWPAGLYGGAVLEAQNFTVNTVGQSKYQHTTAAPPFPRNMRTMRTHRHTLFSRYRLVPSNALCLSPPPSPSLSLSSLSLSPLFPPR